MSHQEETGSEHPEKVLKLKKETGPRNLIQFEAYHKKQKSRIKLISLESEKQLWHLAA